MQNDIGQLSYGYEKIIVSNNFSLLKMIRQCLDQIGPANLKITTFQTSDEFLRSMLILKKKGLVLRNTLITNSLHLTKMIHNEKLMNNVYDEVFMVRNHSKIVLMENGKWKMENCHFNVSKSIIWLQLRILLHNNRRAKVCHVRC